MLHEFSSDTNQKRGFNGKVEGNQGIYMKSMDLPHETSGFFFQAG